MVSAMRTVGIISGAVFALGLFDRTRTAYAVDRPLEGGGPAILVSAFRDSAATSAGICALVFALSLALYSSAIGKHPAAVKRANS